MKIFKIIYYSFFICVAVIAVLLIVSVLPITGNYKVMVVQSGSMEPTIKTGSVVVVRPVSDYKIGDIVTFKDIASKKTITHRINEIKEENGIERFLTKGDANSGPDQNEITKDRIIGKVIFVAPYVGYAVNAAKKPAGFVLIVAIPAAMIILDEVNKIRKEISRIIKNKNKNNENQNEKSQEDTN